VRVRNYAKAKHLSVTHASEYTKNSELSRGRSAFFHGEKKFMLLTERFHFFKRYNIRGIRHVIFYALPTYEQFYVDFVNLLPGATATNTAPGTVMALYSKFDAMELERIIGTQRATKLLQAHNHTHMFC
jgi:U3 small nucleolar RNA-associated protein 25